MSWEKIKSFSGGHRFFTSPEFPTKVAVADQSGATPDATDDGVLFVDFTQPIQAGHGWGVPLIDRKGEKSSTAASAEEALWLAAKYRMEIEVPDGRAYLALNYPKE